MSDVPSRQGEPVSGWYLPARAKTAHFFDAMAQFSQCRYYPYAERGPYVCRIGAPRCKACAKGMGT